MSASVQGLVRAIGGVLLDLLEQPAVLEGLAGVADERRERRQSSSSNRRMSDIRSPTTKSPNGPLDPTIGAATASRYGGPCNQGGVGPVGSTNAAGTPPGA